MAVLGKSRNQIFPTYLGVNRDNFSARHSHVIGVMIRKVKQVAEHLPLNRQKVAVAGILIVGPLFPVLAFVLVDGLFKLRAQSALAVAGPHDFSDRGPKAAATLRVSRGTLRIGHRYIWGPYELSSIRSRSPYGSSIPILARAAISRASIASASSSECT